jgi:hypothetical protein
MFVVYLTHNDDLISELVGLGDRILSEFAPSDLSDEVDFYNSKEFAGICRNVPESVDLEANRRRRREAADLAGRKGGDESSNGLLGPYVDCQGYSDDLPLSTKIDYAVSCIEILGQILRNFTGSLPGEQKLIILKATYLLGLRSLRAMLIVLSDATLRAKEEIAKRDKQKAQDREFIKRIQALLTIIGQIVGGGMINLISVNVGSPDIEEDAYSETLETIGRTDASELVHLSIRLDHSEEYPFESIKKLYERYKSTNRFAQRVLVDLVIENMSVFDIGREMRQRVLATLNEGTDTALISRRTKRLN